MPSPEFGTRLYRLAQAWRRELDASLRQFELTDATWRPLLYLGRLGDGLRQTDLARALDIEGPSLVRLLDNLERQGLIERSDDPADRRSKLVHMTEAGERLYARVAEVASSVQARLLASIPPDGITIMHHVFSAIETALREADAERVAAAAKAPQGRSLP
ncbi:MAG TPA: MarR family transcriptional regulator [Acetobacteraceae bacterium]|nr:MarR family transcriptional regulator [Acetobacteraceae bacterium]